MVTRGIVFDLDDTLYLERDYVRSGFAHIGELTVSAGLDRELVTAWLWNQFEGGTRGDSFDRLIAAHPQLAGHVTTSELVSAYRGHVPRIALLSGTAGMLAELRRRGLRLALLSDGPSQSQRAKVDSLGLAACLDPIILTADHPGFGKPATAGFEQIRALWGLSNEELAYVADNPLKDFEGPRQLGWRTVRVRHEGQITRQLEPPSDQQAPDFETPTIVAAVKFLGF